MAKPYRITIAPGLTLDDRAFTFGEHGADLDLVIARAHSAAVKVKDDATAAEVNAACNLHAVAWGAVLALDPEVAAITPETDPLTVGPILVAAAQRAALPCSDPCALVLAVAEAARLHALANLGKPPRAAEREERSKARKRALLAVPCTVEAAVWEVDLLRYKGHVPIGQPSTPTHHEAMLLLHAEACAEVDAHNAARVRSIEDAAADAAAGVPTRPILLSLAHPAAPVFLPAVRLRGGLCGRSGVTLRPAGESSLAWAGAAWRVSCAALEGPRKMSEPKASAAKIAELPVVCLVDGEVVAACNLFPADIAPILLGHAHGLTMTELTAAQADQVCPHCEHAGTVAGEHCKMCKIPTPAADTTVAERAAAFVAEATRKRDEAFKIEGEEGYLTRIADYPLDDLDDRPEFGGMRGGASERARVRQLAADLLAGDKRAPLFEEVRDIVRAALKVRRKYARSTYDHVNMWAAALQPAARRQALAQAEAQRVQAAAEREDLKRSRARKRAA